VFAILGSGFGLYAYLPALVDGCKQRIVMSDRYRVRFSGRPELRRFAESVQWEENEDSALDYAEGVVLALRPINQCEWIPRCLARSNLRRLLLEKPLADSPESAAVIFDELIRSKKVFRIGYTFRYMSWGKQILDDFRWTRKGGLISIHWSFLAHHFLHDLRNWKRFHATGGGAIRFYGIHVIALLAEIGYCDVTLSRSFGPSPDEIEKWTAVFGGAGLPECKVVVDTRSTVSKFQAEYAHHTRGGLMTTVFANLRDPFDSISGGRQPNQIDNRAPLLSQLCLSLWEECVDDYEWYDATLKLWMCVENNNQFESMQ
jgi:predicted dehydrogenase